MLLKEKLSNNFNHICFRNIIRVIEHILELSNSKVNQ